MLVMGGFTRKYTGPICSSISFMNTVNKSDKMAKALTDKLVYQWVAERLKVDKLGDGIRYNLEHLDASSRVTQRDEAKARLTRRIRT